MPDAQPGPAPARHAVLITRPAADAARTADRVQALGWTPVLAPLLTVAPQPFAHPTRPAHIDAILVTSSNALPALAALAGLEGTPLLAVGDATATRAQAAGFTAVSSAEGDATDLVSLARQRCAPGTSLLLACGAGQGRDLVQELRQAGFRVHRRVAYATRPVQTLPEAAAQALGDDVLRAALFLSADTARVFVHVLPGALRPALKGIDALAIGHPAAAILALLPWRRVRVSLTPTLDGLLTLL